jgi:hypothetical protein
LIHVGWGTVHNLDDVGNGSPPQLVDRLDLDATDLDDLYIIVVVGRPRLASLDLRAHGRPLCCDVVPNVLRSREVYEVVDEAVLVKARDTDAAE